MDSKLYQQRVVIDQINARNRQLKEFDDNIMRTNRKIDVLEQDIEYLSINQKYPFVWRKIIIMDAEEAYLQRRPLINRADDLRTRVHNINEGKERFIVMNYPELMSVDSWVKTLDLSCHRNIQKLIDQCTYTARDAMVAQMDCFEPRKHATYMNHFKQIQELYLNRGKVLVKYYIRHIYGKSAKVEYN